MAYHIFTFLSMAYIIGLNAFKCKLIIILLLLLLLLKHNYYYYNQSKDYTTNKSIFIK